MQKTIRKHIIKKLPRELISLREDKELDALLKKLFYQYSIPRLISCLSLVEVPSALYRKSRLEPHVFTKNDVKIAIEKFIHETRNHCSGVMIYQHHLYYAMSLVQIYPLKSSDAIILSQAINLIH